jgi:hypothetical protein
VPIGRQDIDYVFDYYGDQIKDEISQRHKLRGNQKCTQILVVELKGTWET